MPVRAPLGPVNVHKDIILGVVSTEYHSKCNKVDNHLAGSHPPVYSSKSVNNCKMKRDKFVNIELRHPQSADVVGPHVRRQVTRSEIGRGYSVAEGSDPATDRVVTRSHIDRPVYNSIAAGECAVSRAEIARSSADRQHVASHSVEAVPTGGKGPCPREGTNDSADRRGDTTADRAHTHGPDGGAARALGGKRPNLQAHSGTTGTGAKGDCEATGYPAVGLDFHSVRRACKLDTPIMADGTRIYIDPMAYKQHRIDNWPTVRDEVGGIGEIYEEVRATGMPNAMGARRVVPSDLNIPAWERYLGGNEDDDQLLSFLYFGFPLGYLGPVSNTTEAANHTSATQFPDAIEDFIKNEKRGGALYGPFRDPPFIQWTHVSPLMTRPKTDPAKRRVISDLSFRDDSSVNAYILKNTSLGAIREHCLPTVDAFTVRVAEVGRTAYMFTMDISRAYKNFRSCPLDWPLLAVKWGGCFYLDIAVPFGSRGSSCHIQRVALAVVKILRSKGVEATMYLDDLIVLAPDERSANLHFQIARDLFQELGLPEALEKTQPPAQKVRWLGIDIDAKNMELTIPKDKVDSTVEMAKRFAEKRVVTRTQLQSILGKLLHLSKCVPPARLFVSRLLDNLRGMTSKRLKVTQEMKDDLLWFQEFSEEWNGVTMIPAPRPDRVIVVDACLGGVGGADERHAYRAALPRLVYDRPDMHINRLEALNVVVAVHTLGRPSDKGAHIRILCDNQAAVSILSTGKGHDRTILGYARALWMYQAKFSVKLTFEHLPGVDNKLADALSRAHISSYHRQEADRLVKSNRLTYIEPCMYAFSPDDFGIASHRAGLRRADQEGRGTTGRGTGQGHLAEPRHSDTEFRNILREIRSGPQGTNAPKHLLLDRVPGSDQALTGSGGQCSVQSAPPRPPNGPADGGVTAYISDNGIRGPGALEDPCASPKAPSSGLTATSGDHTAKQAGKGEGGGHGHHAHVLWRPPPVGGRPKGSGALRPDQEYYKARYEGGTRCPAYAYEMGEKYAGQLTEARSSIHAGSRKVSMPGVHVQYDDKRVTGGEPPVRPTTVPERLDHYAHPVSSAEVEGCSRAGRSGPAYLHPAQHKKGRGNHGL